MFEVSLLSRVSAPKCTFPLHFYISFIFLCANTRVRIFSIFNIYATAYRYCYNKICVLPLLKLVLISKSDKFSILSTQKIWERFYQNWAHPMIFAFAAEHITVDIYSRFYSVNDHRMVIGKLTLIQPGSLVCEAWR